MPNDPDKFNNFNGMNNSDNQDDFIDSSFAVQFKPGDKTESIADKLKEQDILVARRTVAKYRENNLRILPASQRKRAV